MTRNNIPPPDKTCATQLHAAEWQHRYGGVFVVRTHDEHLPANFEKLRTRDLCRLWQKPHSLQGEP